MHLRSEAEAIPSRFITRPKRHYSKSGINRTTMQDKVTYKHLANKQLSQAAHRHKYASKSFPEGRNAGPSRSVVSVYGLLSKSMN